MSEARRRGLSRASRVSLLFPHLFVLFSTPPLPRLRGWAEVRLHCQGQSSLLRLWIQMPISSGNTLTNTPRNNVLPATWAALAPVTRTHKMNSHREQAGHPKCCGDRLSNHVGRLVALNRPNPLPTSDPLGQ